MPSGLTGERWALSVVRACPELPQDDLGSAKPKKHLTGGASGAGSALLPVAVEEEQGLVPTVWPGHSAGPSVSSKSPAGSHGH